MRPTALPTRSNAASRAQLAALLTFQPHRLTLTSQPTEPLGDAVVERLQFEGPQGEAIRGLLMRPAQAAQGARPAVLLAHAHGGRYDIGASELVEGRPAWSNAPGPALVQAGFVCLSIDMPTFGTRAGVSESAAAKAALWYGRTLFGQMLGEQAGALHWLASRPDVDASRIGLLGISMGATLGYFLAALEGQVAAVAQLCCYADFATLVETGAHDLHGHYLTIPGLLQALSTGAIAGLVAPRPQLICVGLDDPLTPPLAIHRAFAETSAAYQAADAPGALELWAEAGVGHRETPAMRDRVMGFLTHYLQAGL